MEKTIAVWLAMAAAATADEAVAIHKEPQRQVLIFADPDALGMLYSKRGKLQFRLNILDPDILGICQVNAIKRSIERKCLTTSRWSASQVAEGNGLASPFPD